MLVALKKYQKANQCNTFFPVREGVHAVSGLRLADVKTEKVYEGDNLCDVFVVRADADA